MVTLPSLTLTLTSVNSRRFDGFKKDAFNKDDKGFVTGVVTPRSVDAIDAEIEWVQFDGDFITSASDDQRIYLLGYSS